MLFKSVTLSRFQGILRVSLWNWSFSYKAIENLNQALLLNSNHASAYSWRGRALTRLGNYRGAIEDYTQAICLNPDDPFSYKIRGIVRRKIGYTEAAISDFQNAAILYEEMLELKIIHEEDEEYLNYLEVLELLQGFSNS